MTNNSMYFSNRSVRGYNAPIEIYITRRGRGKTFGEIREATEDAIKHEDRKFIYVVENIEMVKTLTQNKGERFFSALIDFYKNNPSRKNNYMLDKLIKQAEVEGEQGVITARITGGTMYVDGKHIGYIIALSDFANLKRNNFVGFTKIIIDEFIPEKITMNNYDNPRKLASIVQSIARLKDMKIVLLGNSVSRACPVLEAFHLHDLKIGETRVIKDKYGILLVAYMEDPAIAQTFKHKADASISGRLSAYMGEDNLERNAFMDEGVQLIPQKKETNRLRYVLKLEQGDFRVNVTETGKYYIIRAGQVGERKPLWVNNYISRWHGNLKPQFREVATQGRMYFDTSATAQIIYSSLGLIT